MHVAAVGVLAVDCGVEEEEEAEGELGGGGGFVSLYGGGREEGGSYEGSGGVYACGTKGG